MNLRSLAPGELARLAEVGRTTRPDPWVAEVEQVTFGPGAARGALDIGGEVLLLRDANETVGIAVHVQASSFPGAQLVNSFLLDPSKRGQGLGRMGLGLVIARAHQHSGHDFVMWNVHPLNEPMIAISTALVGDPDFHGEHKLVFVHEVTSPTLSP